jgi:hypothetical protein
MQLAASSYEIKPESEIHEQNPVETRQHFLEHYAAPPPPSPSREVPAEYGDTKLALLVRDPEWVYAYWEINDATRAELKLPRNGHNRRMVIRLYKITGRNWPSEGAHYCLDVDISPYASNWYLKLPEVSERWVGELGFFDDENTYIAICRSNVIQTPRNTISEVVDSEWMVVEETFRRLSSMAGGVGNQIAGGPGSRGASEALLRQLHRHVLGALRVEGGGLPSSAGLSSEMLQRAPAKAKDFWLQVHTELVLYGATEPDAKVTVQGASVRLNPDGTFSLRYALPDGEQVLDVKAVNADGDLDREITPVVKRWTR